MGDLIAQSVYACPLRPLTHLDATQTLTAETYYYTIASTVVSISRVDLVDVDGDEVGPITPGFWEIIGDLRGGDAEMHIVPHFVDMVGTGGVARYIGYGRYDTATNLIPNEFLRFVLAHARYEAYMRLTADRVRFRQYLGADQTTNTSANELYQIVSSASREADAERSRIFTFRKPIPARLA